MHELQLRVCTRGLPSSACGIRAPARISRASDRPASRRTSEACEDEECTIATAAGAEGSADDADDFEDVTAYSTTPGKVPILAVDVYEAQLAQRAGGDAAAATLVLLAGFAVTGFHGFAYRAAAAKGARKAQ